MCIGRDIVKLIFMTSTKRLLLSWFLKKIKHTIHHFFFAIDYTWMKLYWLLRTIYVHHLVW